MCIKPRNHFRNHIHFYKRSTHGLIIIIYYDYNNFLIGNFFVDLIGTKLPLISHNLRHESVND